MDKHEKSAIHNIAESCAASISLLDLQNLSSWKDLSPLSLYSGKLTYGHIRGSPDLRASIANLYDSPKAGALGAEAVLVTPGAISANLSAFYALVKKGDHVVCHYPTYQCGSLSFPSSPSSDIGGLDSADNEMADNSTKCQPALGLMFRFGGQKSTRIGPSIWRSWRDCCKKIQNSSC